ncbi:alpha/beta hydrolase [Alphaproteobacteria bacterium]|nr:alpha/beta hydrolase [Alphaproteobacteria bacterium]
MRFDVTGHGESSGLFEDGTIGRWLEDVVFALDRLTSGPQIIVGSSMGGWLGLLAALARPERVAGFLGLAAAPDFVEDLVFGALSDAQKKELEANGSIVIDSDEEGFPPLTLKAGFVAEARRHLLLRAPIPVFCPVRLIQGQKDDSIPWLRSLLLAERLLSDDVTVLLVKDGGHRLNEPQDLIRMEQAVESLLLQCECLDISDKEHHLMGHDQ